MTEQLAPTTLSQFVRLNGCQRYLHFKLHPGTVRDLRSRFGTFEQPMSRLRELAGRRWEQAIVDVLAQQHHVINLDGQGVDATIAALRQADREPIVLAQAELDGTFGSWRAGGRADLIEIVRDRSGGLHTLIADVKASREEQLHHRVQVAAYALLLRDVCRSADLPLARIVGAVVHRTGEGTFTSLHDPSLHFALDPYEALVLQLASDPESPLQQAATQTLGDLPFALGGTCDGCQFNTICLPHAAQCADIALVSDVSRAARSALAAHEIRDLHALAALKAADETGKLVPDPQYADRLALIGRDPVLAPQVDHLIARARAVLKRFDPDVRAPQWLPDRADSPLPDPQLKPHLLQIFLDLQADDLTGLVYLASAMVWGSNGSRIVTNLADASPTPDRERELLCAWATEVENAIRELAQPDAPPLHLVVYDRQAQRVALEACARTEAHHSLLGVLLTWLQERPQIEQATCARVRDVIADQRNLKLTCDALPAVASEVWHDGKRFEWRTATRDFRSLFRVGVFDNLHRMARDTDGLRSASVLDQQSMWVETTSRFGSTIPSQYAYELWEGTATITRDDLIAFAEHRIAALQHLAAASNPNRRLDVPLLPLAQLPSAAGPRTLRDALISFMELEHAASLADLLAHVRLPIARRVLTGRTALLEAIAVDTQSQPPTARFRFAAITGGGNVQPRFKVGDFTVLNEAVDGVGPWEIIRGRIAVVAAITEETIELELTPISAKGEFKYGHDSKLQVQLRCRYTLDEMADDLLGDRIRAALDHLDGNVLARWIERENKGTREQENKRTSEQGGDGLDRVAETLIAGLVFPPTTAQREVIAAGGDDAVRLVQGPPGSGKSRTLGLAVVARLLAAANEGRGLRVAVTAKTHSAAQVALDSIARAWKEWCAAHESPLPLTDLPIVKLGGSAIAPRAAGVRWADPRKGTKDLRALVGGAVVIGGTPGGLSALLETTQRKARWDGLFDLLLIDEASQMSLPEGLLAASALHERGQLIVVGDHRQMPPIIIHAWDAAQGSLAQWQPQRSLFKWLLDADTPVVALDESFRLHRDHAAFLQNAIYHADGINFHSRRTDLLPPHHWPDPLVDAALRHDVPLVVIEHNERGSRQSNDLEAGLVARLVRACTELGLDGRDGIGVVVPHRAQKAALRSRLPELADADSIDTVERFQGGERDVIIVACTASDPDYVLAEAAFLLDPQRLNVALSRARKKLIVVASTSVFNALPNDLPIFQQAALWKRLHAHAAPYPLWNGTIDEVAIRVMGSETT